MRCVCICVCVSLFVLAVGRPNTTFDHDDHDDAYAFKHIQTCTLHLYTYV